MRVEAHAFLATLSEKIKAALIAHTAKMDYPGLWLPPLE